MPAISSQQRAAIIAALQELRRILIRGPEQDFPEGVFTVANDPKFAKDKRRQRAVEFRLAAKAVQDALHSVGPVQYAPVELQGAWRILNVDLYHLDHLPASRMTLRTLKQSIEDLEDRKPKRTHRPSRVRKPRPLTPRQTEVVQIVGECKGNIADAARRLGKDRKTVEEAYRAGLAKLGKTVYRSRDKTRLLPRDKRGQEAVSEGDDLRRQ